MKESENKTLHVLRVEPGKAPEEKISVRISTACRQRWTAS